MVEERLLHVAEDDDLARARRFWKKNGTGITVGVVVGLAIVIGFNFWQGYAKKKGEVASATYNQFLSTSDLESAQSIADDLKRNQIAKIYAELSALDMAARYMSDNKTHNLVPGELRWVLEHTDDAGMRSIARLKLALFYIEKDAPQVSLGLLDTEDNDSKKGFAARYYELMGDAYALRAYEGDKKRAEESYQLSLTIDGNLIDRSLIQLKIDKLGEV